MAQQGYGLGLGRTPSDILQNSLANRLKACEDLLHASTPPQVETARAYELAKCRAMRDGRRRRLTAATGREVPGAGVLYTAL